MSKLHDVFPNDTAINGVSECSLSLLDRLGAGYGLLPVVGVGAMRVSE